MNTTGNRLRRGFILPVLGVLATTLPCHPALADRPATYQVELIVFRNVSGVPGAGVTAPDARASTGGSVADSDQPAYPLLAQGDLGLNGAFQQLARSAGFRPLAHFGWRQTAGSRSDTIALRIPRDIADRTGLSGSIRLYRQGNLLLDLALALPGEAPGRPDAVTRESRIREVRRIRGGTLQYFDDAAFGVIAQVRLLDAGTSAAPE